jgi:DNA repair photolyase
MIGITERGDAALDTSWTDWVKNNNPTILITKNPLLLASHLLKFSDIPNVIVHATITGYGNSILEPNVISVEKAFKGVRILKEFLGSQRIVIRIDPIIPTYKGLQRALEVLNLSKPIDNFRVRISFLDLYNHVKNRFELEEIELPWQGFHAPLELRQNAVKKLSGNCDIEICGEPDFECTGCISKKDCEILNIHISEKQGNQRKPCACLTVKKELLSNKHPCEHNCIYCYWKT